MVQMLMRLYTFFRYLHVQDYDHISPSYSNTCWFSASKSLITNMCRVAMPVQWGLINPDPNNLDAPPSV